MAPTAVRVVERFWQLMGSNDFHSVGEVLSDAFVLEWPQSGERIRGRDAFAAMNAEYPAHGPWRFAVNRIVGGDDAAVSDVFVTDGVQAARAITFFVVNDGKIDEIVEFWPEPFEAPANRRHVVEPIEPAISPSTAEP
jgi:ketosteroid isomerase-like protein